MKTLSDLKRLLKDNATNGLHVTRSFYENGQLVSETQRVISSVTSGGFVTRDLELTNPSEMRYGKASEWEFDNYIAGWSAIWTDPEESKYQVQYVFVEGGF